MVVIHGPWLRQAAADAPCQSATALICRSRDQFCSKNGQELVAEFCNGSFFFLKKKVAMDDWMISDVNVFFSVFVLRRTRW